MGASARPSLGLRRVPPSTRKPPDPGKAGGAHFLDGFDHDDRREGIDQHLEALQRVLFLKYGHLIDQLRVAPL